MSDLNTEIKIGADASGVEAGVGRAKKSLASLGEEAVAAARESAKGFEGLGKDGEKAAKQVETASKRVVGDLQRQIAAFEAGGKGTRAYRESLAQLRGIDVSALKPLLDRLDESKAKSEAAARANVALGKSYAGLSSASDSWQSSLGKIGPLVATAFAGASVAGFIGKVVSVQREFDVLNSSLKTVTGSSAAAEREMSWLKDFAKETPFGLAQATQGFVKMKALGLDPTRAALTSFGNTASAMGKDLNQMIEAVADASTGEFERLKEFGIKAKKEGDNVSLTFQGVTTTIGNSAREITKYLEDIGNTSFGGAMEERAKTLDGTIAALGDTWDELFRTVSTNNVGGLIFDSVTLANGALEDATNILRALGGAAQDAGRDTGALSTIQNGIATVFETVAVLGANLKFVLVGIGNEIGGLAAQVAQAAQFNFSGVAAIRSQMVADAEAARKEIDATTARILNARKAQEEYARYATRNASAATDPRRVDLGGSTPRATSGGVSSGTAKAVKETISEYDKLIKKLSDELPRAAAEAEAAQMGYNKAQTEFLALAGSPVWASFTNSERARVAAMYEGKIASEQSADAAKELSKAYAEAAAERIKTIQSMERAADGLQSQNNALREEIELIGLSTEQQTVVLQQRNDVIILTKEATLAELERQSAITGTQTRVEIALASEIDALKERNELLGAKGVKNAAVDAAKTAADEWQRTADDINQSLTDALMRGFESGKDFAKNMRDTIVNMFKTMVLRPVISAIVNPIAGAATGALGLSGAANAAGGGGGGIGGIGGMLSNANSIYSAFAGGGLGSTAAGMIGSGVGSLFGAAAGNAALGGALGLGAASSAAAASAAAAAGGAAATATAATGIASSLGSIAAAAGPWVLAATAIYGLVKKFDTSGTPHVGQLAQYSAAGGLATSQTHGAFDMGFGGVDYNEGAATLVQGVSQTIVGILDSTATAFGKAAGYSVATGFADDSSKDGAWGGLLIKQMENVVANWDTTRSSKWAPKEFADGEAGQKQYLAALAADTASVLKGMNLGGWANDILNALGASPSLETLAAAVDQINTTKAALTQMGEALTGFSAMTDGAITALIRASGGIESLAANASSYYENFYSEAERMAKSTAQLTAELAKSGIALPASKEAYRALVEEQMAAGEAGAELVAKLLQLSPAFAKVADDISAQFAKIGESAAGVFTKLIESIGRARDDVASSRASITNGTQTMTPAQLAAAIGAAMVYAPNTAGVVGAQGGVTAAAQQIAQRQSALDAARAAANANQQSILAGLNKAVAPRTNAPGMTNDSLWEEIIGRNWQAHVTRFGKGWNTRTTTDAERAAAMNAMSREYSDAKNADVYAAANWQSGQDAPSIAAAQSALAAAQATLAAAQQAEVQAKVDYAAQINTFVLAAGASVGKLGSLREEVVRFYEEQAAAVQSMIATAENLRSVVDSIRLGQLDTSQTAAQLSGNYARDYSMALATTGTTRAGYAESMASTLPTLAEAIKAEASTASDWRVQTGKLLAQATGVAGMLEADAAGTDYQTTSLGLLGSIDTALEQLEGSTKSAEQVIAQAINDGTASQLTGLRAVVAALRGESVPAFAAGGFHAGGLRMVGENGPELEVTGPSRIYSASQTAAMLGGGNANAELVAELRALRADNQAQAAAMVQMQRELNKLMLRWDSQGMPEERIV